MVYDRWRIIADFSLLHLVASFAHLVDASTENSATSLCESWDAGRDRLEENSPVDPGSVSTATVSKWRATTTMRRSWGEGDAFGVLEKKASPSGGPFDHMASWEKIL